MLVAKRDQPFTAYEWRLFDKWLNYIEKGLFVAYALAQNGGEDDDYDGLGVSSRATGVRWYASDVALLDALVYRAAGLRDDENVCFDQGLSDLFDELEADHPKLRDLRNALFGHPPFVDKLVGPDEVLFFVEDGVYITPVEGGLAEPILDPFQTQMGIPDIIVRLRSIFADRRERALQREFERDT
jgi:hypothetical protein